MFDKVVNVKTWIWAAWNISEMAASISAMPISLLIVAVAWVDCETCVGRWSGRFWQASVEVKHAGRGRVRSSVISAARLQSSSARRASPETAATWMERKSPFSCILDPKTWVEKTYYIRVFCCSYLVFNKHQARSGHALNKFQEPQTPIPQPPSSLSLTLMTCGNPVNL